MEFIVPAKLGSLATPDGDGDIMMDEEEYPTVVVCSGEVVEQVKNKKSQNLCV